MLAFALRVVLLALLRASLDHIEQIALFFLQVFLAVGSSRRPSFAGLRSLTSALSAALTLAESKAASGNRRRGRSAAGGDVGQLHRRAAFKRHNVEVVGSCEIDIFLIAGEVGVRFSIHRAGNSPALICDVVVEKHISFLDEERELLVFRQFAEVGWPVFGFFLSELLQA